MVHGFKLVSENISANWGKGIEQISNRFDKLKEESQSREQRNKRKIIKTQINDKENKAKHTRWLPRIIFLKWFFTKVNNRQNYEKTHKK